MQNQTANALVRARRNIRTVSKAQKEIAELSQLFKKQLEVEEAKVFKNQYHIASLRGIVDDLNRMLDACKTRLAAYGEYLLHILLLYEAEGATDHDFAQIINCNVKDMEKYRREYTETGGDGSFFVDAVFVYHAEYRARKGDDGIAGFGDEPFFDAVSAYFLHKLKTNTEFRQMAYDKLEELFPEIRACQYVLKKYPDGKERLEKYYPPLKVITCRKETEDTAR